MKSLRVRICKPDSCFVISTKKFTFCARECFRFARKLVFGYVGPIGALLAFQKYQLLKFAFWSFFGQRRIHFTISPYRFLIQNHFTKLFTFDKNRPKCKFEKLIFQEAQKGPYGPNISKNQLPSGPKTISNSKGEFFRRYGKVDSIPPKNLGEMLIAKKSPQRTFVLQKRGLNRRMFRQNSNFEKKSQIGLGLCFCSISPLDLFQKKSDFACFLNFSQN